MYMSRAGTQGFTLLEVLITLIVLAIGLLGLANLQSKMQIVQVESYQRAQAVLLVQDMVNRVNANRANAAAYPGTNVGASTDGFDYKAACNQATTAAQDVCEWSKALKGATECTAFDNLGNCTGATRGGLIGGRGCVTQIQAPNNVTCIPGSILISVAWQGLNATVSPGNACAQGAYGGDDRLRRVISQRTVISLPRC